jgi:hypothetical protein
MKCIASFVTEALGESTSQGKSGVPANPRRIPGGNFSCDFTNSEIISLFMCGFTIDT